MNNKAKYSEFCERHYVPLMLRPFWLDVVCGSESWNVALSLDQGGEVRGSLVFYLAAYHGFPIIKMPPLTDYSGLWFNYPDNLERNASRYTFEKEVCKTLLEQLPKTVFFYQQWHTYVTNWLPFYWNGFRQTTLYTYQLHLIDEAFLFANLKAATRTHIRKAEKELIIEKNNDLNALYQLIVRSFERQKMHPPFSLEILQKLDAVLKEKGLRQIYFARDEDGKLHSGAYIVWDERCAYYLLSGADSTLRESSAMYFLLWQAIRDQIGKVPVFDFMGSTLEAVERVFRSFGGELTPHFKVTKARNKLFYVLSILLNKDV